MASPPLRSPSLRSRVGSCDSLADLCYEEKLIADPRWRIKQGRYVVIDLTFRRTGNCERHINSIRERLPGVPVTRLLGPPGDGCAYARIVTLQNAMDTTLEVLKAIFPRFFVMNS